MSKKNKKSPRSIQRTQQDVERAFNLGKDFGIETCLLVVTYTMRNSFGADDATIAEFSDKFAYTIDSIDKGYITEADIRRTLKTEYDTEVEVK